MSSKKSVYIITVLLVLSFGVCGLPQSSALNSTSQTGASTSPIQRQFDPPSTYTKLIREYSLPVIPVATTAFFGPRRGPYGIVYDKTGYTLVTDFNRDAIYRLTPATTLNQTATTASEWMLPNNQGRRCPSYIIVNETQKVVWFTDPASRQISRLNWSSNVLEDWNLANIAGGIMPLDLVMESSNEIWFTGLNDTRFFYLNIAGLDFVTVYTIMSPLGGPFGRPTKIATNTTSLYMTDWKYDRIYEVLFANPANALVYNLIGGGFSWDLDVDPTNNIWVTQPLSSLINEQLAHSSSKLAAQIIGVGPNDLAPVANVVEKKTLTVGIEMTPVTPSEFSGPLNVTGDPIVVWSVPTDVTAVGYVPPLARPWEIAATSNSHAWFTEPIYNHVGVVHPDTNKTLMYPVPTAASWTVCIDNQPANPDHLWFTEYVSGKIGELLNATFTDLRVCPSLPAQYPPPNPGSIRWTPGTEIWIDAPSNGFNATHHDSGELGATNHLYARVKNMGSTSATSISVKFYWYNNTFESLASNYIPLPPATPSSAWIAIGTATISSLAAGATTDVYVDWNIASNMRPFIAVGAQVWVGSDIDLYDNIGYCNFTLTTPTAPPLFTPAGIGIGFAAGFVLMAVIALVLRKR